jgi:hypothetical protein
MDLLNIARNYVSNGISVIPIKTDGSKSPSFSGWRKYSTTLPDDTELQTWFGDGKLAGIGVPCGPASGNLVVLDFEHNGTDSAYIEWLNRLEPEAREYVLTLPTVLTPSGGRHIWCRLGSPQPGARLARYANGKTKIEIRGEGHQVLAPGCPAECHKTGRLYEWLVPPEEGMSVPQLPIIPADAFAFLVEVCTTCNEFTSNEQPRDFGPSVSGSPSKTNTPGRDFNLTGTWEETGLFDAGWKWARRVGEDSGFLTRPGKDGGISASIGMVSSKRNGWPLLYVWSTSAEFVSETPFSKFFVYARLKHNGDFSAAARELYSLGYGERYETSQSSEETPTVQAPTVDLSGLVMKINTPGGMPYSPFTPPNNVGSGDDAENRPFLWMSELSGETEDTPWIWEGYIPRGGVVLFSAIWKIGKSTLISHLLKALDGSVDEFLGQKVTPSRVLYLTEEDARIWTIRRDELLIGDHVGMWCRPFAVRSNTSEWRKKIDEVAQMVERYQFDLVVIDTLSKMWPVREENDAGQVEEALMPLWKITKAGTAVLLVHHMRKGDGAEFQGSRGSGGLPSFCEVLMEFRRDSQDSKERKRVITATGRYTNIPDKKLIELDHGKYISHGDPDESCVRIAVKHFDWEEPLIAFLSEWRTYAQIKDTIKARKHDITKWLDKKVEGGELAFEEGKGNKPHMWRVPIIENCTYNGHE